MKADKMSVCYFCESQCVPGICDICNKHKACVVDMSDPYDVEINENPDPSCFTYCEYCYEDRKSQI